MDTMTTAVDRPVSSSTGNMQTIVDAGRVWTDGYHTMSDIVAAAARAHFDHVAATVRAMRDVKTVKGVIEWQVAATCTSIEQAAAYSSKLGIASIELANQGMAPVRARIDSAAARYTSLRSDLA